ncbi:MAG: SdpI family protein [Lachnospiraceae bacterium]
MSKNSTENNIIKNNKKQIIISSMIILLPVIVGVILLLLMPEKIQPEWSSWGDSELYGSRALALLGLPIGFFVVHCFSIFLVSRDSKNEDQNRKIVTTVFWVLPIVSLTICGFTYALVLGNSISGKVLVSALMGLMFVVLGNYMPKCKPNRTIGVRVKWTLQNEENWNKTHRFAGKVWVFGGIILLATMFVPMGKTGVALLGVILLMAFAPVVYSYLYYRKQLKAGKWLDENTVKASGETVSGKKGNRISMIVALVVVVLAFLFAFSGKYEVQFGESALHINATCWDDATVEYRDITQVEYRDQDDPGSRTFGFGSPLLLMGRFENSEFGEYTRYSHTSCDDCIVITAGEKVLVLNGKNEKETKEIYDELTGKIF